MSNEITPIKPGKWQDDIWGCCTGGYFWKGFCCPCLLLNQTHEVLEDQVPDDKEPDECGIVAMGWCLLTGAGCCFVFGCLQRKRIRVKHKIEGGNTCSDFCINGCLPCCAIIQQYKEVDLRRQEQIMIKKGYQPNPDMPHR
ncbi:PLAC8 family-domain-containing protein [Parachaetomium inaequale]|uniref:PLAC8 family-domain-containing protein n=1 Tax=Parachaetomium inaequale TaxID=2588326 RepID=A0AAN6P6D3_9PEZI|nr:PLAC8 family-domain-containing protein [Parachaetomium inaequale]